MISNRIAAAFGDNLKPWMEAAACTTVDPDLHFPERDTAEHIRPAKRVCNDCTVRMTCLEDALAERDPWGIRGGLTAKERRQILKGAAERRCKAPGCKKPIPREAHPHRKHCDDLCVKATEAAIARMNYARKLARQDGAV